MNINIKRAGNVAILFLDGELRRESSDEMGKAVERVLATNAEVVAITFKEVSALLSDGIRILIGIRDRVVDEAGREFAITDLSKDTHFALQITNLLDFLGHVDSLDNLLAQHGIALKHAVDEHEEAKPAEPAPKEQDDTPEPVLAAAESKKEPEKKKGNTEVIHKKVRLTEDEMKTIISHHFPNRFALSIIEFFVKNGKSVADSKAIAAAIGEKEKAVHKMAEELVERGILKHMGAGLYNYAPDSTLAEQIDFLLHEWWNNNSVRSHLLGHFLELEK